MGHITIAIIIFLLIVYWVRKYLELECSSRSSYDDGEEDWYENNNQYLRD